MEVGNALEPIVLLGLVLGFWALRKHLFGCHQLEETEKGGET
jgi:hypothetical protein